MPLLAGAVILVATSCSSEIDTLVASEDNGTTATESSTNATYEGASILVSVQSSTSASTLTFRSVSESDIQHEEEAYIEDLYIYMFKYDSTSEDYLYYDVYHFRQDVTDDDDTDSDVSLLTDDGDAYYSCSIPISTDMYEWQVKLLMIANDEPATAPTSETTTIDEFRESLASATVATGDYCDVLVGNPESCSLTAGDDETVTGEFPMSATAIVVEADGADAGDEAFELSILGASVTAELERTMARVDIQNTIPNLTITNVYVSNTVDASYLFPQYDEDGVETTDAPESATSITILPLESFFTDGTFTELEFDSTDTDDDGYNTYEHVLYLYEQTVDEDNTPQIVVSYDVTITLSDNSTTTESGSVAVKFYDTTNSEYVNVERNHRYTIVLGEGDEITMIESVVTAFVVDDWTPVDVSDSFTPSSDKVEDEE